MNAKEHRSRRIPRARITPFQLIFLVVAIIFAISNPTNPTQLVFSAVILALVGVAVTITTLRKEPAPPEVFLEEEHFEGGGIIPMEGGILSRMWGRQQLVLAVSPQLRILVLSPTAGALEFSLAYGLGRFFGPWILQREAVAEIQHVRTWFAPYEGVRVIPVAGPPWTFSTREPATVLACLEELGYPEASDAFSLW